eukprot:2450409-Ditylum_brightwellii.AAC.1
MNFESGKRRSLSKPSHGGQVNVAEAKAKEEGVRALVGSKRTTNKAGQLHHLSSRRCRPSPSRKGKWEK